MTLDKSILTDILFVAGIIITFFITYLKRKNIKFSTAFLAFFICCYSIFTNYFLPLSLELLPIFKFDKDFTVSNLFIQPDFNNFSQIISDYLIIFLISLFLGIISPLIFKNCRSIKGSLIMIIIPIAINLYFFIMDLIMGGLYKYFDYMFIVVFVIGFYISYFPTKKICPKVFCKFDIVKNKNKSPNYDSIV